MGVVAFGNKKTEYKIVAPAVVPETLKLKVPLAAHVSFVELTINVKLLS
jgi:hypothetical protein